MVTDFKTTEELLKELRELKLENKTLKSMYEQLLTAHKRTEELLRERGQYIETLINLSPDIIYIYDLLELKNVYCNDGIHNTLGYTVAEIQEMGNKVIPTLMHPEDLKIYYEKTYPKYSRLKDNEPLIHQYRMKHKNGSWCWFECNETVYKRSDNGNPIQIFGVIHDITKHINAEEEIKLKNAELLTLNAEKDKFLSILAHDLRSPFQGFISLTQMIADNAEIFSPQELARLGSNMYNSAKNLFGILKNLLDWAKMQNGTMVFQPKKLSLSDVIEYNLKAINEIARQKGIRILNEVNIPIHVFIDEKMINSVLLNLLSNAIKFTHRDGTVTVSVNKYKDEFVEIAISDTGIGMNHNIIEKLFKFGEKTGRKGTEGELSSGLGLLLCKEFIEKHGGKIFVESQENIGSTFYFTLQQTDELNT